MQVHTKDGQELQEVMEVMVLCRRAVFSACYSVPWEEADHAWKKYMHEQKQAVEIQAVIGEAMNGQVGKKPTEKVQERDDQSVKKCCTKYLIIVVLVIAVLVQACLLWLK